MITISIKLAVWRNGGAFGLAPWSRFRAKTQKQPAKPEYDKESGTAQQSLASCSNLERFTYGDRKCEQGSQPESKSDYAIGVGSNPRLETIRTRWTSSA